MSVYEFYQRKMHINTNSTGRSYPTLGEKLKADSDKLMELTWDNDIQSKRCFIYDYFHDDFITDENGISRALKDGMTYENTNKTRIDAKFIIKSYQSLDKDQVEYYLQFKPSQKTRFSPEDELYYFETDYRKRYGNDNFLGMYVDIPDDEGRYHKWMICRAEIANQFPKYLVVPCSYEFMWVETHGHKRVAHRMWAVLRQQLSYTIGTYTDRYFTRMDNQNKIWLPMNKITENIWYTSGDKNLRVIVGTVCEHPTVWKVTKVENAQPFGLQKLTIYQDVFNEHTDYINLKTGEMYADYYDSEIFPEVNKGYEMIPSAPIAEISASSYSLKVGGSYKTLTTEITKESSVITSQYSDATFTWSCKIDDEKYTDKVIWREATKFNQIKLKFPPDSSMLGKKIQVECAVEKDDKVIKAKILELQLIE